MSEHQVYEFAAVDRPLTAAQQRALRSVSSRATITSTRFHNEYDFGDLKADPAKLLSRYFDAHLYTANWGTRRLMFKLPAKAVDVADLRPYFVKGSAATLRRAGTAMIIDAWIEDEDGDEPEVSLAALLPLRAALIGGDLRAAYVMWLAGVSAGDVGDDAVEPAVPPDLAAPAAGIAELADVLRIDAALVRAAAEADPTRDITPKRTAAWVAGLPAAEQVRWLRRAFDVSAVRLRGEMLVALHHARGGATTRRTAGELRARAQALSRRRSRRR